MVKGSKAAPPKRSSAATKWSSAQPKPSSNGGGNFKNNYKSVPGGMRAYRKAKPTAHVPFVRPQPAKMSKQLTARVNKVYG